MKDKLGDRMKHNYENRYRIELTRKIPVILRCDGKAFHTLTKRCNKPFDNNFITVMNNVAYELFKEIQGAKCAYVQSDEISVLLTDFDTLTTDAWFNYNLQKMVSVAASIASVSFSRLWENVGIFDCRAFNIPKEEVANYFVWRQKDWVRNSISMFARSFFSQKELNGKSVLDIHKMLSEKGKHWHKLPDRQQNGLFIYKTEDNVALKSNIKFVENRDIIEKYLFLE